MKHLPLALSVYILLLHTPGPCDECSHISITLIAGAPPFFMRSLGVRVTAPLLALGGNVPVVGVGVQVGECWSMLGNV